MAAAVAVGGIAAILLAACGGGSNADGAGRGNAFSSSDSAAVARRAMDALLQRDTPKFLNEVDPESQTQMSYPTATGVEHMEQVFGDVAGCKVAGVKAAPEQSDSNYIDVTVRFQRSCGRNGIDECVLRLHNPNGRTYLTDPQAFRCSTGAERAADATSAAESATEATSTAQAAQSATSTAVKAKEPIDFDTPQVSVEVGDAGFKPAYIRIRKGTKVTWTFVGGLPHSVTSREFDSYAKTSGTFEFTFERTGTFDYHDTTGSTIQGTVIVTE